MAAPTIGKGLSAFTNPMTTPKERDIIKEMANDRNVSAVVARLIRASMSPVGHAFSPGSQELKRLTPPPQRTPSPLRPASAPPVALEESE